MRTRGLSRRAFAVLAIGVLGAGGVYGYGRTTGGGGGATFMANVFVAPDGTTSATSSCTASASAIDYTTALAASHVCQGSGTASTGLDAACSATASLSAVSGATIGIKTGLYVGASSNQGYILGGGIDCSGGKGGNYNPNAVEQAGSAGSTTGWVTIGCADGDSSLVEFNDQTLNRGSVQIFGANLHLIFGGSCYRFDETLYTSPSGGAYASNLQFVGTSQAVPMVMFNYNIPGGTNIMLKNVAVAGVACGKIDANVTSALRCNASNAWYESEWTAYGTATGSCLSTNASACGGSLSLGAPDAGEPYVHGGYANVRLQNIFAHDQIAVCSDGSCQHPGCLLTGDDGTTHVFGDLVIDHLVCERVAVQGIELHANGTIVQNSVFACPVNELDTSGGSRGQCRSGGSMVGLGADASTLTNVLVRHNSFLGGGSTGIAMGGAGATGGYSNVRVIGNIVGGLGVSNCSSSGVTVAYNSFWNGTTVCGTNSETLGSDPFTDSDAGTTQIAGTASQLDPSLTGSPAVQAVPNAGSPNSDYTLAADATGAARSSSSSAGAVGP